MSTPTNGYVSTDTFGMATAERVMEEIYGDLKLQIGVLGNQQQNLLQNWSGEAASTFGIAVSNFIEDFEKINQALSGMLSVMGVNRNVYENTNESSSQMAQQFAKNVGGMITPGDLTGAMTAPGLPGF
jgi:uncharacterized protein YukE